MLNERPKPRHPHHRGIRRRLVRVNTQAWVVLLPNHAVLHNNFGAVGYTTGSALEYLGRGEAEFDCVEDTGEFYRFAKCDEFWVTGGISMTDTESKYRPVKMAGMVFARLNGESGPSLWKSSRCFYVAATRLAGRCSSTPRTSPPRQLRY